MKFERTGVSTRRYNAGDNPDGGESGPTAGVWLRISGPAAITLSQTHGQRQNLTKDSVGYYQVVETCLTRNTVHWRRCTGIYTSTLTQLRFDGDARGTLRQSLAHSEHLGRRLKCFATRLV